MLRHCFPVAKHLSANGKKWVNTQFCFACTYSFASLLLPLSQLLIFQLFSYFLHHSAEEGWTSSFIGIVVSAVSQTTTASEEINLNKQVCMSLVQLTSNNFNDYVDFVIFWLANHIIQYFKNFKFWVFSSNRTKYVL